MRFPVNTGMFEAYQASAWCDLLIELRQHQHATLLDPIEYNSS